MRNQANKLNQAKSAYKKQMTLLRTKYHNQHTENLRQRQKIAQKASLKVSRNEGTEKHENTAEDPLSATVVLNSITSSVASSGPSQSTLNSSKNLGFKQIPRDPLAKMTVIDTTKLRAENRKQHTEKVREQRLEHLIKFYHLSAQFPTLETLDDYLDEVLKRPLPPPDASLATLLAQRLEDVQGVKKASSPMGAQNADLLQTVRSERVEQRRIELQQVLEGTSHAGKIGVEGLLRYAEKHPEMTADSLSNSSTTEQLSSSSTDK